MRIIIRLRRPRRGEKGGSKNFLIYRRRRDAVTGTYIYELRSSFNDIGLGREGGETRKSTAAYPIGTISIEMGLGTTKIYIVIRLQWWFGERGGGKDGKHGKFPRRKLPEGTAGEKCVRCKRFCVGGRIYIYILRVFCILQCATPAPTPPHILLYIYGVYGALTCVSLMAGGEYQKLLFYVNSERGKKDFTRGIWIQK